MKLSIITVVLNAAGTIRNTIASVLGQDYPDLEYIVIDGGSTDGTVEIVRSYGDRITRFISEPDAGMYDALNKGIALATGDIIGSLNADDVYTSRDILSKVAAAFAKNNTSTVYGDVHFVKANNPAKITRVISARSFRPWKLRFGFMPPHPAFFARKELFENNGLYRTGYDIAADYELIIRFLYTRRASRHYLPVDMVRMTMGGRSTRSLKSNLILNREIVRACRENGIYTNLPLLFMKYLFKITELR